MSSFARDRLRVLASVLALSAAIALAVVLDARARIDAGRAQQERTAPIAAATGLSELALSTSSTWLRHPALAVPSAGASDAPLGLDVDPAGAVVARPGRERALTLRREGP
jgi:hypothetical protein